MPSEKPLHPREALRSTRNVPHDSSLPQTFRAPLDDHIFISHDFTHFGISMIVMLQRQGVIFQ